MCLVLADDDCVDQSVEDMATTSSCQSMWTSNGQAGWSCSWSTCQWSAGFWRYFSRRMWKGISFKILWWQHLNSRNLSHIQSYFYMKLSVGPLSALRGHWCCLVFSNRCSLIFLVSASSHHTHGKCLVPEFDNFVYILFLMDCGWLSAVAQVDAVGTWELVPTSGVCLWRRRWSRCHPIKGCCWKVGSFMAQTCSSYRHVKTKKLFSFEISVKSIRPPKLSCMIIFV